MEEFAFLQPLLLTITGLVIGALLKSILKHSRFPYTVGLFGIGLLVGILNRSGIFHSMPQITEAVDSVANINPDLILYLFLPILIFDAAYELNMHIFKKTLANATLLAAPGLVICMILTGVLMVGIGLTIPGYENWTWAFALMFGALISATDPVAVVALLRELGTSKRFSTLVDAESMLNDGTGIVLFMLFYGAYTAAGAPSSPVLDCLFVVAVGALLGWLLARLTIWSLGQVGGDAAVQNSAIIVGAYITFIAAQAFMNVSGVIALVAFGLTISYVGRPHLKPEVHKFMQSFWELASYIANTLIFIIVGIVIAAKVDITWQSIVILFAVYIGINLVRAAMVLILYPIMKKCGYGLTLRESVILVWGGLRGALGLTLALMVSYTLEIPEDIRRQILLFTAGIVTLTLTINATTIRWLLLKLGLTKIPSAKMLLDFSIRQQIADSSDKYLEKLKNREALVDSDWKLVETFKHEPEPAPEVKFHPDDLLADLRLRILNKERALCWNMYDEGIISFVTLRCLTASLDEQYDQSGRIPLSSRKRVFNFYNNSFYTRWLKNFPLVRKWSDVYFHDKIVNGYDLARGFFITQKKSLELIDEFAHSKVLTPNETAQMDILRGEIGENIEHITAVMEEMAYDYPVSYRCGVTRKSIRMLLANERRQIEQFRSEGILSASEAGSMFDDIDERHASIGSLTKTWKRNRKLNDASRGL